MVEIGFDPTESNGNRRKHGISLAEAAAIDWETFSARPDVRQDYGEPRMVGFGYIGARLHCLVFVERDGVCRAISLRKTNSREMQTYAET